MTRVKEKIEAEQSMGRAPVHTHGKNRCHAEEHAGASPKVQAENGNVTDTKAAGAKSRRKGCGS